MDGADERGVEGEVGTETWGVNRSGTGDVGAVRTQGYTGESGSLGTGEISNHGIQHTLLGRKCVHLDISREH